MANKMSWHSKLPFIKIAEARPSFAGEVWEDWAPDPAEAGWLAFPVSKKPNLYKGFKNYNGIPHLDIEVKDTKSHKFSFLLSVRSVY